MKSTIANVATLFLLAIPCSLFGQSSKPLTNTDVVKMVPPERWCHGQRDGRDDR